MGKNKGLLKTIVPWIVIILIFSSMIPMFSKGKTTEINYNQFVEVIEKQDIKELSVMPSGYITIVKGTYTEIKDGKEETVKFTTNLPQTDLETNSLMQLLQDKNIKTEVLNSKNQNVFLDIIVGILPYILLIGGMVFVMKTIGGAGGNAKAFEFGNSRAKLEKNNKTRFTDVAGADEEKINAARTFAQNIGLAFQIKDDILDVTSSLEKLGKLTGSDSQNGKSTYVTLLGVEKCQELVEKLTNEAMASLDIFENNDALKDYAQILAHREN